MYKIAHIAVAMVGLVLSAPVSAADGSTELARKFGAREWVRDIGISPEGKQILLVTPLANGGENVVVINLADLNTVPIFSSKDGSEVVGGCQFVLENRVICRIDLRRESGKNTEGATRLVALSTDGKTMEMLSAGARSNAYYESNNGGWVIDYNVTDNPNAVLMTRYFAPEVRTSTLISSTRSGLAVEQVDLLTMKRKNVEAPKESVVGYVTDGLGNVRLMVTRDSYDSGYAKNEYVYSYRDQLGNWSRLSKVVVDGGIASGFEPEAVDPKQNLAYGFDDKDGFQALYAVSLDGSGTRSLIAARADADIDHLMRIGRNARVVGVSYATDRREYEFFDPELKRITASLGKALGQGVEVAIVDSTQDEGKLVIFAGSDVDPGRYYLFDKATKQLGELFAARPELDGIKLSTMKPVQFPASDGTMIPGYLTLPTGKDPANLPAIVMPHGGPSSRDEWGFDWLVQYYASRGYAVLQPNYRGSSGLGSQWFQKNGFQSWATAIGDVNDGGRWLVAQGIAAPDKLAIVGWSYGGYAALQSPVLDPDLFKAIVAIAPVTDLDRLREESRFYANFSIVDNFIGRGPHVDAGSPARHADRFEAPVLLFHGDQDMNVAVNESRLMKSRLEGAGKSVRYVEFAGLAHSLDNVDARARLLSESDAFLRESMQIK